MGGEEGLILSFSLEALHWEQALNQKQSLSMASFASAEAGLRENLQVLVEGNLNRAGLSRAAQQFCKQLLTLQDSSSLQEVVGLLPTSNGISTVLKRGDPASHTFADALQVLLYSE